MTLSFVWVLFSQAELKAQPKGMVSIPQGRYHAFYNQDLPLGEVVPSFYIDQTAVTNADFLEFVKANPHWQRSKVSPLLADKNYLSHWEGDLKIGEKNKAIYQSPVVNVSWFAAKAYAKWKGKRLPTVAEWEYVAASPDQSGKIKDLTQYALSWNATPSPKVLPKVGTTYQNKLGVKDMNGLIWEWTFDFNNFTGVADSRDNSPNLLSFCGASALQVTNNRDYPAFLRYGFRSSLKGNYCISSLGFRCAMDKK